MAGGARRLGLRMLGVVVTALLATACGPLAAPDGDGLVVGGVVPCSGLGPPPGEQYAAATVTALAGTVTWRTTGPGSSVAVLPATVVTRETVATNSEYQFALAPGDYVLEAHFPPPANVVPFTGVTVRAGTTTNIDIPNRCI